MKRHAALYAVLIAVLCSFLSGCLYTKTRPRGLEPSAQPAKNFAYAELGTAEGTSSAFTLLWILPVTPRASVDEAIEEAVRSKGGDTLIRMTVRSQRQVWVLGTVENIYVTGTVIRYNYNAPIQEKNSNGKSAYYRRNSRIQHHGIRERSRSGSGNRERHALLAYR
ncbi:MAG: hypothetical protein ACRCUT_01930 [Spirochaetota bacterium]